MFKTLTPLWTGDAWGENKEIRPSSIMGSLRFWFYMYCKTFKIPTEKLDNKGIPSDNINEYIKNYNKKESFESLLEKELKNSDYDTAISKVLEKIKLPMISSIFGCTGWKSQIIIQEINASTYKLKKSEIDFYALYNKLQDSYRHPTNSKFWSNKLLFNNKKNSVVLFTDIEIIISLNNKIFLEQFKKFLKFYQDKVIICGGKKSFGFGFCKLETEENLEDVVLNSEKVKLFDFKDIDVSSLSKKNVILGFNFKHYQRLKEKKKFRGKNFGKQSKASNFFFSTKLIENNDIYIVGFNEDEYKGKTFTNLMETYSNFNI